MLGRNRLYIFILLCFNWLCGFAQNPNCSQAAKFYSKDSINILTFGASTVFGTGGAGFQGFLKENINYCYSGKTITVENFGIPGETTAQGLERIDGVIKDKTGFIMILMGANDALAIEDKKLTLRQTENNMRRIVQKCLNAKLIVILGTIQNFNDRNDQRLRRVNGIVNNMNVIFKKIAADNQLQIADINFALGRNFRLYSDSVHPNNTGYRIIAFVWFDALNKAIEKNFLSAFISQNYPNPARTTTKITYTVPQSGNVLISLYDLNGRFVRYLINDYENAGIYNRDLDLTGIKNGIYIYVYLSEGHRHALKMLVSN